jgi:hypothetical protein
MTCLALLLAGVLATIGPTALAGEQAQMASVKDAQAALIDALTRHDRAAFERVLDADPVFFLPGLSQGREAILKSWIIFLLPSGCRWPLPGRTRARAPVAERPTLR